MTNKYRIYDLVEKQYVEEPDFRWMFSRSGKLYNSETDEWHDVGVRYLVEFSTGLKDKNGVEIFEGDLLGREIDDIKHVTYEIIYNDCGLVAKSLIPGSSFFFPIDKVIDRYTVLGNVHDNLELIK